MGQILIVDEWYREPALDGGSRAIADLVRTLHELGHHVDIVSSHDALTRMVSNGQRWQTAFLSRPELSLRCMDIVSGRADRVIYIGQDLHHLRLAGEAEHGTIPAALARAHLAMERQCWNGCDLSIYPDPAEVAVVADVVGEDRAHLFPYFRVDDTVAPQSRSAEAPFVMLGGAGHSPNVTGLRWYIEAIAPQLEMQPAIDVIGWWPEDRRPPSGVADLRYVGQVSGVDLAQRLRNARGMLVPLRTGAGLKSKVIDALATATPLITTSIGMQGIHTENPVAFVSDDADEWPLLMEAVASTTADARRRCAAGVEYVAAVHGAVPFRLAVESLVARQ